MRAVLAMSIAFALLSVVAAPAQTPLQLQHVCGGLVRPVFVTAPPGDLERIFVVEQIGRVRIVKNGVLLPTPFLDLSGTIVFGGEAGLLGLAFHPDFAANGKFFVFHNANPWLQAVVKRFTVSANPDIADATSSTVVLNTAMVYGNHNGGMLAFGRDGMLHIGFGDGGSTAPAYPNDPFNHAQRGDSLLGKMLRIDVDNPTPPLPYGIPADNPFVGPGDPRDEIWAMGLRHPWRFSFDRLTGDLWIADVGGVNEEIDFEPVGSPGGRNYGWSCMSGTTCNGSTVCTCFGPELTPPLHEYTFPWQLQRAVIGGYVYRGSAIPDLRGSYFFADFNRKMFWSLRRVGGLVTQLIDRTAELVAPAPFVIEGPTSFGEDAFGELYVCDIVGDVYKIVPNGPVVVGVTPFGTGTPGCSGPHGLNAVNSPVVGNPAFTLRCDHGPVAGSGLGIGAFASLADVAGSDPIGWGIELHLQVTSPLLLLYIMLPDAAGVGDFALAIPPDPTLSSMLLHAQGLWLWDPAVCAPTQSGWSASHGLSIVLQP